MFSPELTTEFQEVLKEEYGKDVTLEEAGQMLSDFVGYFDTLAKINHQSNISN